MDPVERTMAAQDEAEAAALGAQVSAIDQRIAVACADLAHTLRCLEGVSAQAARVLEANGDAAHLAALLGTLDALVTDAGRHSAALGSLGQCRDCQGSA